MAQSAMCVLLSLFLPSLYLLHVGWCESVRVRGVRSATPACLGSIPFGQAGNIERLLSVAMVVSCGIPFFWCVREGDMGSFAFFFSIPLPGYIRATRAPLGIWALLFCSFSFFLFFFSLLPHAPFASFDGQRAGFSSSIHIFIKLLCLGSPGLSLPSPPTGLP